jgi:hypothetical protein
LAKVKTVVSEAKFSESHSYVVSKIRLMMLARTQAERSRVESSDLIKLFILIRHGKNRLACLTLSNIFSLVKALKVRLGKLGHHKGVLLFMRLSRKYQTRH